MNSGKKGLDKFEITALKDLEKEFTTISKVFVGKETEANWEARDLAVKRLRSILFSTSLEQFSDDVIKGIHDNMANLVKSIHSLRTSVALEALSLIKDISQIFGNSLDQYTMEILLGNLLKCSSVTKKMIATKASETTKTLLSNTNYYTKMTALLCKTSAEKNVQLRQFAATYLQTLLQTHGSKENVRSMMESANSHPLINQFLKKGLADASPAVRDACRQVYWAYYQFWSQEAEKLCKSLDPAIQRQIEKSKLSSQNTNKPKLLPKLLTKRSNSTSSITSHRSSSSSSSSSSQGTTAARSITPTPSSRSATPTPFPIRSATPTPLTSTSSNNTLFKKPALNRSTSAQSVTKSAILTKRQPRPQAPIPAISAERSNQLESQKLSRLSHISNVSAPATTISHQMHTIQATASSARRTQSEFHHQSVLASASLLHMLKSIDTQMRCKGIRQLSDRLKSVAYDPTQNMALPPNVPSKLDLLPLLMDLLTRHDLDLEVYRTLMSWESLAGIFVHVMSVNYYCPTLIIANGLKSKATRKEAEVMSIYSKGLERIKMFLKRNDDELAQRLFDILQSVLSGDQKLLDTSVKKDIQLFPLYKNSLVCGLLTWMDEIVCDFIGLPEDEDGEMLMEGSKWLNVTDDTCSAGQWFDINAHVQTYLSCVIQLLPTKEKEVYLILCNLLGHLKMANQRVFENELKKLDAESLACVEKALGLMKEYDDFSISFAADDTSILLDEACGIAADDVVIQDDAPQQPMLVEKQQQDQDMMDVERQQQQQKEEITNDEVKAFDQDSDMTQDVDKIKLTDHTNTLPQEPPLHSMSVDTKIPTIDENGLPEKDLKESNNENPTKDPQPVSESKTTASSAPPNKYTNFSPLRSMPKRPRTPLSKPTRRISNLEEEEEYGNVQKKKMRKTSDSSLCGIQLLKEFVSAPLPTAQEYASTLFPEIQQLSSESAQFWSQKEEQGTTLLFATFNAICEFLLLLDKEKESLLMDAITTIKILLVNQSAYLKTIDIAADQKCKVKMYTLTKVLVISHDGGIYSDTYKLAKETLERLSSSWPSENMLNIFWELANDKDILAASASPPPLDTLLLNIQEAVPRVERQSLEQSLEKNGFDLIKKNMIHTDISVRKSSTFLAVKMHKRLGYPFYKDYLVNLPPNQLQLLEHYISRK